MEEQQSARPLTTRPPIIEHYAFVTRRNAAISPATREFMRLALKVIQQVSARQDGPMAPAIVREATLEDLRPL